MKAKGEKKVKAAAVPKSGPGQVERTTIETALRLSEERYRNLFETSKDCIFIIDRGTGQIIHANPAACQLYGYSLDELLRMKNTDISTEPEKTAAAVKAGIANVPLRFHRKKDGSVFPVEIASGFFAQEGRPLHTAFIRDISERMRAQEALQKNEHRFKALIENAFEGITVVDATGKVLYESPGLKRILGYSIDERYGVVAFDTVHPDDHEKVRELFNRAISCPDTPLQMTLRIQHKDGTWRWIECAGRNLLKDANINGIVVNYRDITERKKTEEERLKLEQEIQQAQKLESLGVLAGGIAHDFNNLLAGIFGYIDLARAASKDNAVSGYLATALSTIGRARGLTQQLLTFAKGGMPVRQIGPLSGLIRETAQFALSGSNVSCIFDVPEGLSLCNFDKNQIAQVIDNIVINAQQAMPMGGTIKISARNVAVGKNEQAKLPAGSYVKISIKDKGIGIPEEILPRIFDPFFTTKQKGSGIGLATCYSIVKRHDGWIDVESEPGKGSTFHIYLPASGESPAIAPPEQPGEHKGGGRILVMDDEDVVREALSKILASFGYSVVCRNDGEETLDFFVKETSAGRPFAAIILDLTIPGGKGGRETVSEIRKLDAGLPVFVSSGYADDPVMANPGDFGFTGSIRKPFMIEELTEILDRHLTRHP